MPSPKQSLQKQPPSPTPEHADERRYNGWKNYETWCVNLWLSSNDQGTYETMRELVAEADTSYNAGQAIREYVEEFNPLEDQATMYTDLLNGALSLVDWRKVAEAFSEDA